MLLALGFQEVSNLPLERMCAIRFRSTLPTMVNDPPIYHSPEPSETAAKTLSLTLK